MPIEVSGVRRAGEVVCARAVLGRADYACTALDSLAPRPIHVVVRTIFA